MPCSFFQIPAIITLILTKNQIEYIPSCFSQSSIQLLQLNENRLHFNQSNMFSSSKLLHLDISHNKISYLPSKFFYHFRRLRTLILNGQKNLFEQANYDWIRSLTTRNQLTLVICDENFPLPLCLFDNLFRSNKLLSIELNSQVHCDCSLVYLSIDKIHFRYCHNQQQQQQQQGKCNAQSSRFEHGHLLVHLQTKKYRQICTEEYEFCQNMQLNRNYQLTTKNSNVSVTISPIELLSLVKNSSIDRTITTTMIVVTSSKKENSATYVIISFVLLSLIMTLVCLYLILSRRFSQVKNRNKITDFMIGRRKRHYKTNDTNIGT